MKRILTAISSLMMVLLASFIFTGCNDKYDGMQLSLSTNENIVIELDEDTSKNYVYVDAIVSNCKEVCSAIFSSTSDALTITYTYLGDGVTRAKIQANETCDTSVKVQTTANNVVKYFNVSAIRPLQSITLRDTAVTYSVITNKAGDTQRIHFTGDMFNFEPAGSETSVKYTLDREYTNIGIDGEYLVVAGEILQPTKLTVTVSSAKRENISTVFEYVLLPNFKIDGGKPLGLDADGTKTLIRNNKSKNSATITVDFENLLGYEIIPSHIIYGDSVLTSSSNTEYQASNTSYQINLSASQVGESTVRVYGSYKNYPKSQIEVCNFKVITKDEVTEIRYTLEQDGDYRATKDIDVYSAYGQTEKGQKIYFLPYPNPATSLVPTDEMTVILSIDKDTASKYVFYNYLGEELQKEKDGSILFEVVTGRYISVKSLSDTTDKGFITAVSKAYKDVTLTVNLLPNVGVQDFHFEEDSKVITKVILSSNEEQTRLVNLVTDPENASLRGVTLEQSGKGFIASINEKEITIKSIAGALDEQGSIRITFPNKHSKVLDVEILNELRDEELVLTSATQLDTSNVSYYNLDLNGNLKEIIIKNSSIIPLYFNSLLGAQILNVEFSYADLEKLDDLDKITDGDFKLSSKLVSAYISGGKYYLSSKESGLSVVRAKVKGYVLDKGAKVEKVFTRDFVVEVYNPLRTIELSKYEVLLYSNDSLGYYDKSYSQDSFELYINKDLLSLSDYQVEIMPNLSALREYITCELDKSVDLTKAPQTLIYNLTANKYEENYKDITLTLNISEKYKLASVQGKTLSVSISVVIENALKVQEIELKNIAKKSNDNSVNGQIYIDLTTTDIDSFPILTNVLPENALNKSLNYEFIASAGTSSNILTINSDGLIKLSADKIGGSGHIRITPVDRFVNNGGIIEPDNLNEKVSILIEIYIADGKKESTAKYIYNIGEIKDKSMHYKLISNAYLDGAALSPITNNVLKDFNGGLYGAFNGGSEPVTIRLSSRPLFEKLGANGCLKNIIFVGEGNGQAFVCNENNGTIENVVIDAVVSTNYVSSSIEANQDAVGGIAGVNNNIIKNCEVCITIKNNSATGYVGGIAGINGEKGVIENCSFNVYTFEDSTHNTLTGAGAKVGGIAGKNDGQIKSSKIKYYYEEESKLDLIADGNTPVDSQVVTIKSDFDISKYNIVKTDLTYNEVDSKVLFKFYAPSITGLTDAEHNAIKLLNTISYKKLFNLTKASEIDAVRVVSSNNSIISTTTNSLTVNGVGEVTLKLFPKTNYSLAKEVKVKVVYYFSEFYMSVSGVKITEGSSVSIKYGDSFSFKSNLKCEVIAVNRLIPLVQEENFKVNFVFKKDGSVVSSPAISSNRIGLHSFVVNNHLDLLFEIEYYLSFNDVADEFNDIIRQNTDDYMCIEVYNGAQSLKVNTNKVELQPTQSYVIEFEFISDAKDDDITFKLVNQRNEEVSDIFNISSSLAKKEAVADKAGYFKYTYEIFVSIKVDSPKLELTESYTQNYKLTVSPNSIKNIDTIDNKREIIVKLLAQEIISMETTHHLPKDVNYVGIGSATYDYKTSNILTPGTSGMLSISLFPSYAEFDYVTITSSVTEKDSYSVALRLLQKNADRYTDANINLYTRIENGIRVYKDVIKAISENSNNMGRIYIKTILSQDVDIDTNFDITIQPYLNGKPTEVYDVYTLQAKYLDEAQIYVNEEINKSYVAKYCEADVKILIPIDQHFDPADVTVTPSDVDDEFELSAFTESFDYSKGLKVYSAKLTVGDSDSYDISARVNWVVNGRYEVKYSSHKVNTLDFVIDNGTQLAVDHLDKDVFNSYIDVKKKLDFVFNATYNKEKYGDSFDLFMEEKYFVKEVDDKLYVVNRYSGYDYEDIDDTLEYGNFLNNIYYVNGNTETLVKDRINEYIEFAYNKDDNSIYVIGKATGSVDLRFRMNILYPDGSNKNIEFDFTINVSVYTDEELPRVIRDEADFLKIDLEAEAQDYILVNNIVLNNYKPISTEKINSLDGNNYSIIIRNFAEQNDTDSLVEYALFTEVTSNSLIKNVTVNYHYLSNLTVINTASLSSVNIAGFAITNNGLIYNCEVVAFKQDEIESSITNYGLNVRYGNSDITSTTTSVVAGFVINNNTLGSITNCRVGGTEKTIIKDDYFNSIYNIKLQPFSISAQGDIAGFVYTNSGNISSSFFNNAYITNNSLSDYSTKTAGFVVNNNSGQIVMSYARGVYQDGTEIHASKYGINSVGISAGFVYSNRAVISDCYSNIRLVNNNSAGRASAGFVYLNNLNGVIENCYSASQIKFNTTTQMNFSGVGETQEFLNAGIIKNSYYYDQNIELKENNTVESPSVEEYFDTPSIRIEVVNNSESYYGFAFSSIDDEDGVWTITPKGPELVEANKIAISKRNYIGNDDNKTYSLPFVDGYDYGSINNPILIRNAKEFNEVFGNSSRTSVKQYYDLENNVVFGNYRLISNIDFKDFSKDVTLNSSKLSLTQQRDILGNIRGVASFEGNGLYIKNISMSASRDITDSFGLFKSIEDGASFKNTNIVLGKVDSQGGASYGISAGDVACVGTIAGIISDSNLFNVKVTAIQAQSSIKIEGQNLVGGIAGKVVGKIRINNVSTENISVKALQTAVLDYVRTANPSRYSYAGGLFGVIDSYSSIDQVTTSVSDKNVTAEILKLAVKGNVQVEGGIVGGVMGYVGPITHVQDALYELGDAISLQKLTAYNNGFAGGIAGVNKGTLNQVRAEHNTNTQNKIEEGIDAYYASASSTREGNYSLFETEGYSPSAIGGLVGKFAGGEIFRSYSKINVISKNASYAGGMVGYATSKVKITEAYTISDVYANSYIGGLIGYAKTDGIDLHTVNAFNYWSKDLLSNSAVKVTEDAGLEDFIVGASENHGIDAICPNINIGTLTTSENLYVNNKVKVNRGGNLVEKKLLIAKTKDAKVIIEGKGEKDVADFSYSMIDSKEDRLEKAAYVFSIADNKWSKNKWERNLDQLFNSMTFIVKSDVFYINTYEDLNLLNIYPDATFIINKMVDCTHFNNTSFRVSYFSGTLKGKDDIGDYGFKNLSLENPLFTNAYGANFLGFRFVFDKTFAQADKSSFFIQNARSITIKNLEFNGVNFKYNFTENGASAIVIENVLGGKNNIDGIIIKNSIIDIWGSASEYNVGMVIGQSKNTVKLNLSNINLLQDAITNKLSYYNTNESGISRAGLLVGYSAGDIIIDSHSDGEIVNSKICAVLEICDGTKHREIGADKKLMINKSTIYAGGIIGQASNTITVENLDILSHISAYSTKSIFAGGIVGSSNNIKVINSTISSASLTANFASTSGDTVFVGGLAGELKQSASFQNAILKSSYNVTVNCTGSSSNITVGGLVGQFEGKEFACTSGEGTDRQITIYNYSNLSLIANSDANDGTIYAGGVIGRMIITPEKELDSIKDLLWIGNTKIESLPKNSTLYFGGIVGFIENNSLTNTIELSNNYSGGNLYITNSNTESGDKLYAGGILGMYSSSNQNLLLGNNYSLMTLFNNESKFNYFENEAQKYLVNAIIGNYNEGKVTVTNKNIYSSSVCLTGESSSIATNEKYSVVVEKFNEFASIVNEDGKMEGNKFNPIKLTTSISELTDREVGEHTYYYLESSGEQTIESCDVDIPSGVFLACDIVLNQNTSYKPLFKSIANNSVVSGITYKVEKLTIDDSVKNALFVRENRGIVFGCSTVMKAYDLTIEDNVAVSVYGFVGENSEGAIISQCYTNVNIRTNGDLYGFADGDGFILDSYSSGILKSPKTVFAFGFGKILNCYTTSQINHKNFNSSLKIFDGRVKNSFYDHRALQYDESDDNKIDTNNLSIDFSDSNIGNVEKTLKETFKDTNSAIWTFNKDYNNGYPTLTSANYNITSKVSDDSIDEYYQITNLGKLEQINSLPDGKYKFTRDLYGNFGGSSNYEFKTITNSFTGVLNGGYTTKEFSTDINGNQTGDEVEIEAEYKNIDSVRFTTGGIFSSVENTAQIDKISFSNITVNETVDNFGLVANQMIGGTISKIQLLSAIEIESNGGNVGGIVGDMAGGELTSVTLNAYTNVKSTENDSLNFGGAVGNLTGGTISTVFNKNEIGTNSDSIGTTHNIGGIVGYADGGAIQISANKGIVVASSINVECAYVGGILGQGTNATITNCYNSGYVIAKAKEVRDDGDDDKYKKSDFDAFDLKYRNGEVNYSLFKTPAYAGGIAGKGGNIVTSNSSYKPTITDSKLLALDLTDVYKGNIIGGYEVFKPYKINVYTDNAAITRDAIIAAVMIILEIASFVIPWGKIPGLFAKVIWKLVKGIHSVKKGLVIVGITSAAAVGFAGNEMGFNNYSYEIFVNGSDHWNKLINISHAPNLSEGDYRTFAEIVYGELYDKKFNETGLPNKYVSYASGLANNATITNSEALKRVTKYEDNVPVEFFNLKKYDNGNFIDLDVCAKLGLPELFTQNKVDAFNSDYYDESIWQKDNPTLYYELKDVLSIEYIAQHMVYKQEEDEITKEVINVYQVNNAEQLWALQQAYEDVSGYTQYKDKYIRLMSDIDLSTHSPWRAINGFTNTFDGNGKHIFNLETNAGMGLFEQLDNATIKDLRLSASISNKNATDNIGLLANSITGKTQILDSEFDGRIESYTDKESNIGGIIGFVDASADLLVSNSRTSLDIIAYNSQNNLFASFVVGNSDDNINNGAGNINIALLNNTISGQIEMLSIGNEASHESQIQLNLFAPSVATTTTTITNTVIQGSPSIKIGSLHTYDLDKNIIGYSKVLQTTKDININTNGYDLSKHKNALIVYGKQENANTIKPFDPVIEYNDDRFYTLINETYSKVDSTFKVNDEQQVQNVYKKTMDISYVSFNFGSAYLGNIYKYGGNSSAVYYELYLTYLNMSVELYYNEANGELVNAYITDTPDKTVALYVEPKVFGIDNLVYEYDEESDSYAFNIKEYAMIDDEIENIIKSCANCEDGGASIVIGDISLSNQAKNTQKAKQESDGTVTYYHSAVTNKYEVEKREDTFNTNQLLNDSFTVAIEDVNQITTLTLFDSMKVEGDYIFDFEYTIVPKQILISANHEEIVIKSIYEEKLTSSDYVYKVVGSEVDVSPLSQNSYIKDFKQKVKEVFDDDISEVTTNESSTTQDGKRYRHQYTKEFERNIVTLPISKITNHLQTNSNYISADELLKKLIGENIDIKNEVIDFSIDNGEIETISKYSYYTERNYENGGSGEFIFEYDENRNVKNGEVYYSTYLYTDSGDIIRKTYSFNGDGTNFSYDVNYYQYNRSTKAFDIITEYTGYDLDTGFKLDGSVELVDILGETPNNGRENNFTLMLDTDTKLICTDGVYKVEYYAGEIITTNNCAIINNNLLEIRYKDETGEFITRSILIEKIDGYLFTAKKIKTV